MFNNRQKYQLDSELGTLKLDRDPMGWNDTETEIGRSEKTFGIFLTISNNLQFTGASKDYLETAYQVYGVNANVKLTKHVKHPQTDEWGLSFEGNLNFTTRKIENNKLKIDFIEGGLREVFVSQLKEKFELNRTKSIEGNLITPLVTSELTIPGRDIFLLSKYQGRTTTFETKSGKWASVNEDRYAFHPIPITVTANTDNDNLVDPFPDYDIDERSSTPSILRMFFLNADRDRGLTRFSGSVKFKAESSTEYRVNAFNMKLVLKRYTSNPDGSNITFIENLFEKDMGEPAIGQSFNINIPPLQFNPLENDSYALGIETVGQYGGGVPVNDGAKYYTFTDLETNFTWAEDSFYERTNAPFLTGYEAGQRLAETLTGKRKFISSLLSEGAWKDLGFTCGGWIRNLKRKVDNTDEQGIITSTELKDWALTISFEDFYKSIHAILPVGYGIVTKGAKQFITLEHIRFFFQPYITIKLGQVSNVKRETASEYVFSSITTGYTKGGNYEKPLGLDEYNIQSTNTTPVTVTENKYEVLGLSRADSYGVEQARRLQYKDFPDEDTPFDKDNFLIDAKFKTRSNVKDYYDVRLWQDDFEQAPAGVYSPETAFNLRLSPANSRNRHALWFNSATVKYKEDEIRFSSSEGNSELKTKITGKPEVKENGDTLISELSNPIFEPEWINFEYPFTQEILDTLQGTTKINDKEINNYYGLVEFINENNQKERGYLFSAKIKGKFTFKLLKSYSF